MLPSSMQTRVRLLRLKGAYVEVLGLNLLPEIIQEPVRELKLSTAQVGAV